MSTAAAVAHPNVALSKYWGKTSQGYPAVPSLSVTLSNLTTVTRVRFDEGLRDDRVVLNGRPADTQAVERVRGVLGIVRKASGESRNAEVRSRNDFPTASGLASSASGFAALALAAARAANLDWDAARLSDLARRGSASAARSIFGGYVELLAGPPADVDGRLFARPAAAADHLPLTILVCVVTDEAKSLGSRDGMRSTMERSPYARAWLEEAPTIHRRLREALLARDFAQVGELSEASALAMHACAIAAGVIYWNGSTMDLLERVRRLRAEGLPAYASIDAGPHVKVLVRPEDASGAHALLAQVPGVKRVIEASPGEGARPAADGEDA